jgi:DNA-directed RNA polymerase subunit RPC12/RpoP
MSTSHYETITCPSCGTEQDFEVWDSVNGSQDPDLKEQLKKGELTRLVCENCSSSVVVNFDILYHDMEQKIMVLLRYPDENGDIPDFDDSANGLIRAMGDDYVLRSVYSFPDLLEKIRIFDDGLDDVTIEILKYLFSISNQFEPDDIILYEGIEANDKDEEQIVLIRPQGSEFVSYHYPLNKMDILDEPRRAVNLAELKQQDMWINVDRYTIADYLTAAEEN